MIKNNIRYITKLFKKEYATVNINQEYKNSKSRIIYTCRYGETHYTTLTSWKRNRRCGCYKKWERILKSFNKACNIISEHGGFVLSTLSDYSTTHSPIVFINCSGKKVKISLNNLQLCEKIKYLKFDIIFYYTDDKKLSDVINHFNKPIISMALRLWGFNNSNSNRFKKLDTPLKDVLYKLYWKEEKHPSEIAKEYNCSSQTVTRWLKNYTIPLRTKSEARMGKLNPIYGIGHTKEARKKMSQAFIEGRNIGFHTNWGKCSEYETPNQGIVTMRSGWEVKTANFLTHLNFNWLYEPETFRLTNIISYKPDFYLPSENLYIEVKGRTLKQDKYKVVLFKKLGYNILLWDAEELLKRGIITSSGSTELNRKYRNKKVFQGIY